MSSPGVVVHWHENLLIHCGQVSPEFSELFRIDGIVAEGRVIPGTPSID